MSGPERPNVVLITVDSLRPDHLGCYGYGRPTSPGLDAFAQRAVLFENAWATGPNTPFSFPGLMASRMPLEGNRFGLFGVPLTLAQMLRTAGYRTQGFVASNPYVSSHFGYDRGFDELVDFLEYFPAENVVFRHVRPDERVGTRAGGGQRSLPKAALQALVFLRGLPGVGGVVHRTRGLWRRAAERAWVRAYMRVKWRIERRFLAAATRWIGQNRAEPFFLWLHLMTVHEPYAPPARLQEAVGGPALPLRRQAEVRRLAAVRHQVEDGPMRPADLKDLLQLYDAEVRHADEKIRRILGALKERGWLDSCLVVIAADHGEQFHEHGRLLHPSCHYDELLRVPLILRAPGMRDGARVSCSVGLVDVMPTLADLLGIELPAGACTGRSLRHVLAEDRPPADGRLYASESLAGRHDTLELIDWHDVSSAPRTVSFQNAALKLIVDCTRGECQVFDLRADPQERRDLSSRKPELARIALALARLHVRRSERRRLRLAFPEGPPRR